MSIYIVAVYCVVLPILGGAVILYDRPRRLRRAKNS